MIEGAELDDRQDSAEQRPSRFSPCPQHPIAERSERGHGQRDTHPRLSENQLPECEREAGTQRIDRAITRFLQNEESLEKAMHRMRWIRQAEMRQRVS